MREQPIPDFYVTKSEFGEFRSEVQSSFKEIAGKLDSRTTTNWGVIWSATGVIAVVVLTIAGGAWALMKANNTALEKTVQSYEMRLQRLENLQDNDAKRWQNFVYQQVTSGIAPAVPQLPAAAPQPAKP